MMNKKLFTVAFIIVGLAALSACSGNNIVSEGSGTTTVIENPTGYPDGGVQRPYLMYEGTLYQHTFERKKVSKDEITKAYPGYEYVASIKKISNKDMPDEELEGSRFSEGAEVYVNGNSIIVYDNGCVQEMEQVADEKAVPEDFYFILTWNCYGVSSYNSQTGKLVKTTDATNPGDYVTEYRLTNEEEKHIYNLIDSLDVNSYPDIYNPNNGLSEPSMTLILTVNVDGDTKTIKAENIALSYTSKDAKGQKFLSVCKEIRNRLTETEEWKSLPEYEVLYD
jgi:hypothetical protein